ncbi:MAG: hypothetical protein HGA43_08255, partial [Nitrospirae bacterium]|nr:hypothetical protein [Nitrospirota bacterium]
MNMSINKTTIFSLVLLLFMAATAIQLTGCGPDAAPVGSKITVEAFGTPVLSGSPISNPSATATSAKTQHYLISVADAEGLPMNNIDVNLYGQFSNGQNIQFGGAIGSAPTNGSVTLTTTKQTDRFGFLDFAITVPYFAVGVQLQPPYNQTAQAGSGSGTLTDNIYFYTVTSLDLAGESTAFSAISIPLSGVTNTTTGMGTGSVDLSWKKIIGANRYNVYAYTATNPTIGLLFFLDCDPVAG